MGACSPKYKKSTITKNSSKPLLNMGQAKKAYWQFGINLPAGTPRASDLRRPIQEVCAHRNKSVKCDKAPLTLYWVASWKKVAGIPPLLSFRLRRTFNWWAAETCDSSRYVADEPGCKLREVRRPIEAMKPEHVTVSFLNAKPQPRPPARARSAMAMRDESASASPVARAKTRW